MALRCGDVGDSHEHQIKTDDAPNRPADEPFE